MNVSICVTGKYQFNEGHFKAGASARSFDKWSGREFFAMSGKRNTAAISLYYTLHIHLRERDGNKSLVHSEKELGNITPFSKLDSGTWARWVGRGHKSTEAAVHP